MRGYWSHLHEYANILGRKETPGTRTKKKRRITYKDSFQGCNVILHYHIHFLSKNSSFLNHLVKFQSMFNLTDFHYSRPSNEYYVLHILCIQRFFFALVILHFMCLFLEMLCLKKYCNLSSRKEYFPITVNISPC